MKQYCDLCSNQYNQAIFKIDDFTLCYKHASEYLHQKEHPTTSIHRQKFDMLLEYNCEFIKEEKK